MATGLYATVTRFPFLNDAADAMMRVGSLIIDDMRNKQRLGEVLDEAYGKVTETDEINEAEHLRQRLANLKTTPSHLGSAWWLECYKTHGFHYHTFAEEGLDLSFRRVLFIADKGFTIELYPIDFETAAPTGPLERYELAGAAFAELAFDGRIVHRFRPTNGGKLYAYSMHARDVSDDDHAAATQTHPIDSELPKESITHNI